METTPTPVVITGFSPDALDVLESLTATGAATPLDLGRLDALPELVFYGFGLVLLPLVLIATIKAMGR